MMVRVRIGVNHESEDEISHNGESIDCCRS